VGAIDAWKAACETFSLNHGVRPVIAKVSEASVRQALGGRKTVDLVAGGCPCQGFSTSGKRALDDPRNGLVLAYLEAVKFVRPRAFLFENVEGFRSFQHGALLDAVIAFAKGCGYKVSHQVVLASDHGVPQRRRRFILVGTLDAEFHFPEPSVDQEPTFRAAVADLSEVAATNGEEIAYACDPLNDFQRRMRDGATACTEHVAPRHSHVVTRRMSYLDEGESVMDKEVQSRKHIPTELVPRGFPNSYRRIWWDQPAPTITRNFGTPSSANCIHPSQPRGLTIREAARCQSFRDTFKLVGTQSDRRLLVGNAVPPLLAEALGRALGQHLADERWS
jgi:DNA (cytosine-5)-methyltransferase 1